MIPSLRSQRPRGVLVSLAFYLFVTSIQAAAPQATVLEVRAFPVESPAQDLEPQVLDFRYAPYRWQTCIGLPDDPYKSIVGSDGGLYYDYGGGRFHDFKTRVLAQIDTEGTAGEVRQRLHDARTPIVITEQDWGGLTLQQYAWARAPESGTIDQWSEQRVDYLWLKLVNRSAQTATGQIVIQIDPKDRVIVNEQRCDLIDQRDPSVTFATASPACNTVEYASQPGNHLLIDDTPGTHRNWARPTVPAIGASAMFSSAGLAPWPSRIPLNRARRTVWPSV